MSLPNDKAEAILDLCLSNESVQMKAKVYEILSLSGIQPNDPMFLVLALTGQMRVFLETAPLELGELLKDWKTQSSERMAELTMVISQVEESQKKLREIIQQNVEEISSQGVDNIRAIHKASLAEIISSNTEVEQKVKELVKQLNQIYSNVDAENKNNIKIMQCLIKGMSITYSDLDSINLQIQNSLASLEKLRIYSSKKLMIFVSVVLAGFFMMFGSFISLAFLSIQKPKPTSSIEQDWNPLNLIQLDNEIDRERKNNSS